MCIKWKIERWCTDIKLLNNWWAPLTFLQNNNGTLHKIEKLYLIVLPYCEYWPTLLFNTNEYNNKVNDKQKQKIFTSIYYYHHAKYSMENRFTMWKNMATACIQLQNLKFMCSPPTIRYILVWTYTHLYNSYLKMLI